MKKLMRVIFSRYFISGALIFTELILLLYLVISASNYSGYVYIVMIVLQYLLVLSLINREANPEYKVSWLAVAIFIPLFGVLIYVMFYSRRETKKDVRLMRSIHDKLGEMNVKNISPELSCADSSFDSLKLRSKHAAGIANDLLSSDYLAELYENTASEYFPLGEKMYERMLSDIASAERFIFLEYFIIKDGEMWNGIFELLKKKASEGVEVRLIYDDIGCMKTLPSDFPKRMNEAGIACVRFAPVSPRVTVAHNNRDHRKILVVDGTVAYTGGINISDEYINRKERFGHWKDGGVRVCGMAAVGFTKLFLSSLDLCTKKTSDYEKYISSSYERAKQTAGDSGFYIPFSSGPASFYPNPVGKNAILGIINTACDYVYITTPYLIIDYDLTEALCSAARRGVDVRIITPGKADKKLVKIMTKSAYPHLMKSGVKIYEYLPGFIHEKLIVADDSTALISTINLDYRSLVHHFEDALWIYGSKTVLDAKDSFVETLSVSDERGDREAKLTFKEKIVRNVMRIFAPLL